MEDYGAPEVLRYVDVKLAPLAADEVRIRTAFAAVNHTDLEIRAGNWPVRKHEPFPYTPGVEAVGVVEQIGSAVQGLNVGQPVITMMQGLGGVRAERPGGYADFVTVAADAASVVPESINLAEMAAIGLAGVTAYWGLRKLGELRGKRILITGAAGGVGSAATAIARALGAVVTGLVVREEHADYVHELGASAVIIGPRRSAPDLGRQRFDGVLDTVGGALFPASVTALDARGVLSLVGAVGGGEVKFDAWHLITPVILTGYSTETLDGRALREAIGQLARWLSDGTIRPPDFETVDLRDASSAHARLEAGGVNRRMLLAAGN
jgi:NADPH2:quinone reductase